MGRRAILCMARKMSEALEELRKKAQHKPANGPPRLPRPVTQKIVNRLLAKTAFALKDERPNRVCIGFKESPQPIDAEQDETIHRRIEGEVGRGPGPGLPGG